MQLQQCHYSHRVPSLASTGVRLRRAHLRHCRAAACPGVVMATEDGGLLSHSGACRAVHLSMIVRCRRSQFHEQGVAQAIGSRADVKLNIATPATARSARTCSARRPCAAWSITLHYLSRRPLQPGVHGFWAALWESTTLQGPVPAERWDADACYSVEQAPGKSYARFAAFVQVRMLGITQYKHSP